MSILEQIQNYEAEKAEIVKNVDFEKMEIVEEEFSMLEQIMNYENKKAEICKGVNFDLMNTKATPKKQTSRLNCKVNFEGEEMFLTSYPRYGACINA